VLYSLHAHLLLSTAAAGAYEGMEQAPALTGYVRPSSIGSWRLQDAGHQAREAFTPGQDSGSGPQGQREHGHPPWRRQAKIWAWVAL